jgi:signal transduction histidine kinase
VELLAESASFAWPLALTLASVALADRFRVRRRREDLNRALHELRRPLQALVLSTERAAEGQLDQAIAALGDLDREINGGAPRERRRIDARALAEGAVARWSDAAARARRPLELAWVAGPCEVEGEPSALARALDNLVANALEHGAGRIRIEGTARPGRVRIRVSDEGRMSGSATPAPPRSRRSSHGRRGHGLRVVASVAAEHGGRFACCGHAGGTSAVIELPIAGR